MHTMWSPGWLMGRRIAVTVLAGVASGAVALTGCSSSGSSDDKADPTTPASTSAPTVLEDGTTAPGTELKLGKTAMVRLAPKRKRGTVIDLAVTSVQKGKLADFKGFDLDDTIKKSTVYYVKASVKNVGKDDLAGRRIVLYGSVSDSLVVQPVEFGSMFEPCDYEPLPKPFKKSEKAVVCMVMLAPKKGKLIDVQWRPSDNAEPISWLLR